MILQMFSIFDSKAEAYQTPYYVLNEALAVRPVQDAANNGEHPIGRNPADYTLFHVGAFDDEQCEITPIVKKVICNCLELVRPAGPDLFAPDPEREKKYPKNSNGQDLKAGTTTEHRP